MLALLVALAGVNAARAQRTVENVGNEYIRAHVITASNAGRFWLTTGTRFRDPIRFLFATDPSFVTSNLVFRVSRGAEVNYYCNTPDNYNYRVGRPAPPTGRAIYRPYDSLKVTADTLSIYWSGMSGYDIVMRFIPEKRSTIYDDGTDMLMEFSYRLQPFAPAAELGILMMLDTYNSQAAANGGGGQGDYSSATTSNGYFPVNSIQYNPRFTAPNIPKWYHVGNFLEIDPRNDVFPIHRLTGRSHGGDTLTEPSMFAIGHWDVLKNVAWDLPAIHYSSGFSDVATITRWDGLAGEGTVRTAFGLSDKAGNSNFTCRDDRLFVDIAAPRLITQAVKNGPYSQPEFDVEMWISNTNESSPATPTIRLQTPINSFPSYPVPGNRLLLDAAATRADTTVYIPPRQTVKIRWRLKVNPASTDTLAQLNFFVRHGAGSERRFLEECSPLITVKGWQEPPPPPDTLAPRIELVDFKRDSTLHWDFRIYDRHPRYAWDLGLDDPIQLLASENMSIVMTPGGFPSCDTTQTIAWSATVTDTSRKANATFRAIDCAGNDSIATISYLPRPDTFPPQEVMLRSGGLGDCNSRHYDITLIDSTHQTATIGDHGFGFVVAVGVDNFDVVINGGQKIIDFQKTVTVVADVIDSMRNGGFALRVFDYAGNETVVTYGYCTRYDTKAPDTLVQPLGGGRYQVSVSDRRAWDRGLRRIDVISNLGGNMRIVDPPVITIGDPIATFNVEAIDPTLPGELVLDVFDSVWTTVSDPENHVTRMVIRHTPGTLPPGDTIAPDIAFAPANGSDGANVIATVDEEHYVDGIRYPYDTGLEAIWVVSATPNIRLGSVISFIQGDTVTTFRIEVIDTLIIGVRDSIVIGARDGAGNVRFATYTYPIRPDTLAPLFIGAMDSERTTITAELTDARPYDRGLGSIAIENGVNIEMRGPMPNIRGRDLEIVRFDVTDPSAPVSGTFVLRDLVGTIAQTPETGNAHIVRIPFSLPSIAIEIALPEIVEGGEDVVAAIIARTPIGADVDSLGFDVTYSGAAAQPISQWRIARVVASAPGPGVMRVTMLRDVDVLPGDTIGTITFPTELIDRVHDLNVTVTSARVNGGTGRVIEVAMPGDAVLSVLSLPPALMRVTGDSVTYINGECDRILTTSRQPSKPTLTILGLRPQPLVRSGGSPLEIDVRNLPSDGALAELVGLDGVVAASIRIDGDGAPLVRRLLDLPDVAHGTYILRVSAASGVDQVKVVVVD